MGRHKKPENARFEEMFGAFMVASEEDNRGPMTTIIQLDGTKTKPCRHCGRYPRLHIANFKDKVKYPDKYFMTDAGCGQCDGKWYHTAEEAIAEWNRLNVNGVPRDPNVEDGHDFIRGIMKNFRIPW